MSGSAVHLSSTAVRPGRRKRRPALPLAATSPGDYVRIPLPPGAVRRGPVRAADQGISASERPHAERTIKHLFRAPGVDMVAFYDQARGTYEVRSRTGFVRWERWATPTGELRYVVVEQQGENPLARMDGRILTTLEEEIAAAGGAGKPVPRERNSIPDAFERLSQLWDDPRAPDFVYIPTPGGDPNHPGAGSHGIPDVVQSRAPLVIAGPGIARGAVADALVRHTDIAPTVADLLGVAPIIGTNASGVPRQQLLKWQDGRSLSAAVAGAQNGASLHGAAERAIIFAVDGMSQTVMLDELRKGNLPNIARLVARGTTFRNGSIAEYPTVTWTNHNTVVTGASPGHNGVVNNSWYERAAGRERLITDGGFRNSLRTGQLLSPDVETLYEAVERSFPGALTIAINQPAGRGADMSVLDLHGVGNLLARLPKIGGALLKNLIPGGGSIKDALAGAMGVAYWDSATPPKLGVFEFTAVDTKGHLIGPHTDAARIAMRNVDREIGTVLDTLAKRGMLDSTALVLTADHGMEHQETDPKKVGGWKEAFAGAAAEGSVAIESTRFVYVKSLRVAVEARPAASGGELRLRVVNDDEISPGQRPPVANVGVTVRDATGRTWNASTAADGSVVIPVGAVKGPLRVVLQHSDFSREELTVPLA